MEDNPVVVSRGPLDPLRSIPRGPLCNEAEENDKLLRRIGRTSTDI